MQRRNIYCQYSTNCCYRYHLSHALMHDVAQGRELNVTTKERIWSFISESDEDAEFWRIALLSVYDRIRSEA